MAVFIKVSQDGNYLYFCKTIFNNDISEREFIQRANMMPTKDFLKKYINKLDDLTVNKINRVKELYDMELSALGYIENDNSILYFAGDETFSGEDKQKVKEEAMEYARRYHAGDSSKMSLVNSEGVTCFAKKEPISFEEYKRLMNELDELTKVMCIKKEFIKKSSR